jgi:hypothetical protein
MSALAPARLTPEAGSPEWRAALFAQAIAYAAHLSGPISPHALHRHLRTFIGESEDGCGWEVCDAVLMLIQTGLFTVNTMGDDGETIIFRDDTMLTVGPVLTAFVYGEIGRP